MERIKITIKVPAKKNFDGKIFENLLEYFMVISMRSIENLGERRNYHNETDEKQKKKIKQ